MRAASGSSTSLGAHCTTEDADAGGWVPTWRVANGSGAEKVPVSPGIPPEVHRYEGKILRTVCKWKFGEKTYTPLPS